MAGDYSLGGLAVPESLNLLQDLLDRVRLDHPEVDGTDLSLFETAIVEIHGNVIKHGRPPGKIVYAFTLNVTGARLEGTLTTSGDAVPHLSSVPPTRPVDTLAEVGRGIWLADTLLDELEFSRAGDLNTWRMVRRCHPGGPGG